TSSSRCRVLWDVLRMRRRRFSSSRCLRIRMVVGTVQRRMWSNRPMAITHSSSSSSSIRLREERRHTITSNTHLRRAIIHSHHL
ncbi:hypothetical protein EV175_007091, partial [Coemansia sp. RSA 1933]